MDGRRAPWHAGRSGGWAFGSGSGPVILLSGPEGGFSPAEEAAALAAGFSRASLGPRVLRAETAPLVALSLLA